MGRFPSRVFFAASLVGPLQARLHCWPAAAGLVRSCVASLPEEGVDGTRKRGRASNGRAKASRRTKVRQISARRGAVRPVLSCGLRSLGIVVERGLGSMSNRPPPRTSISRRGQELVLKAAPITTACCTGYGTRARETSPVSREKRSKGLRNQPRSPKTLAADRAPCDRACGRGTPHRRRPHDRYRRCRCCRGGSTEPSPSRLPSTS